MKYLHSKNFIIVIIGVVIVGCIFAGNIIYNKKIKTDGARYEVCLSDITWENANIEAAKKGGKLVCINSKEEFNEVCSLAEKNGIEVCWVGMHRHKYQDWNNVKWDDGSDVNYIKWYRGEPTYYTYNGIEETCMVVLKRNGEWYFNDEANDVSSDYSGKLGYIIEYE